MRKDFPLCEYKSLYNPRYCDNFKIFKFHFQSWFFCYFLIRYEREEAFMALNLGVTSCQSLEISLDQFVRGEVLEGSNAYYCEKCKEKVLHLPFLKNKINLFFMYFVFMFYLTSILSFCFYFH